MNPASHHEEPIIPQENIDTSNKIEPQNSSKPKGHLLIYNIGKKKNVGTIIRSACAFNIDTVFLISKNEGKKNNKLHKEFNFFGNHGTINQTNFKVFESLKLAKEYFQKNNIYVCGVEIMQGAESIVKHPFKGDTVFMLGNEGAGMNDNQKMICDHFVYIPQYTDKTASLNIACAATLIFHHFALWANYDESPIHFEKFQIQDKLIGKGKKIELLESGSESEDEMEKKTKKKGNYKSELSVNKTTKTKHNEGELALLSSGYNLESFLDDSKQCDFA